MKKFLSVILSLSILNISPIFASSMQDSSQALQADVEKAVHDYNLGTIDENGNANYKAAITELKTGAYKNGSDEYKVIIAILASLLCLSLSQQADNAQINACIDRCSRYDGLPYRVCKRDCALDTRSH